VSLKEIKHQDLPDGSALYALKTDDGYVLEVRETPVAHGTGDERLRVIGLSCLSGCPVRCTFCATGSFRMWRKLSPREIVGQVDHVLTRRPADPEEAWGHRFEFSGMGEPFLNLMPVRNAIAELGRRFPRAGFVVSTIGIRGADFSWIRPPVTLNLSVHTLREDRRRQLVPYEKAMSVTELGAIERRGEEMIRVTLTFADESEYNLEAIEKAFDPSRFSIGMTLLTPI